MAAPTLPDADVAAGNGRTAKRTVIPAADGEPARAMDQQATATVLGAVKGRALTRAASGCIP
jgi:hypothetical protein